MRKKEKPFVWKVPKAASEERPLERLEIDTDAEGLTGIVQDQDASDIEERLYGALVSKFGKQNVVFQPSYLGIRNVDEVRPDFAIYGGARLVIVYADDEFTHGSAETKQHDKIQDARLMAMMDGEIESPVHIMGDRLRSKEDARRAVEETW